MTEPLRVLIIDDDQVDRMALLRGLRAAALEFGSTEAVSVEEALHHLETGAFDCVFLDFQLPGGDGMRVLRTLRASGDRVPVIMLTGQQDEELAVELMKAGASDYIPKGKLSAERLERSVRAALRVAEAERTAAAAVDERERALAIRARFYATMSHELRTPINAMLGYTDLLLAGAYGPLGETQTNGIQRANRAAHHLLELVNDVLDLSKMEAGKLEVQLEPTTMPALIHDLLTTLEPMGAECGSDLVFTDEGCDEPIVTDPRRVRQILLNLISNAIKFGRARPVRVHCTRAPEGGAMVEVADQGVGIALEDVSRVFEEFVQLDSASERGTGLGLPISKRLAELLGGSVEVESRLGEGSTFRLRLPPAAPELDVPRLEIAQ